MARLTGVLLLCGAMALAACNNPDRFGNGAGGAGGLGGTGGTGGIGVGGLGDPNDPNSPASARAGRLVTTAMARAAQAGSE